MAAAPPPLRVRPRTINSTVRSGDSIAIADVDGDGKPDVLLADARQIVWFRNPTWERFVMAENLTPRDHVCLAARDLDGDGKAEVAVGAGWNPNDTTNSGGVFILASGLDPTRPWTVRKLPHEPTTHRMDWVRRADGTYALAVLPMHGRANIDGAGVGVKFLGHA